MTVKKRTWFSRGHRNAPEKSVFHGAVVAMLGQQRTCFKRLLAYLESKDEHDGVK